MQDERRNIWSLGFGAFYIRDLIVFGFYEPDKKLISTRYLFKEICSTKNQEKLHSIKSHNVLEILFLVIDRFLF